MGFDAGALLFKIQAVGAQLFKQDMRESKTAIEGVDQASSKAKTSADGLGKSTDDVADSAKKAKQPLDEQAKATKDTGDESDNAAPKQKKQAKTTEEQAEAAKKLAAIAVTAGLAIAAMVGLSVAKFTEFDAQMANTSAATMATASEQRELADAALEAGADTAYSATEAAAAQEELAKAGQSVADITGGSLAGSLALAAAGQLEVARSAEIMATVLTQFRLPATDASRAADVLAAGAGKAQGSVDDLALALTYVGPLAASMGWSLEETAGTIAYFSTQGIAGEKAGTALRGVLAALQAPSMAASKELAKYNIQVYDANGKMLGAAGVAQQLKEKLGGLTDQERLAALGRIFGNEALSAATLLYEGGADAVSKWTSEVDDSGYAAEQAAMRQDNLAGDIEKLGGAFDTALIKSGSAANDTLREMVQSVTALVDWFTELPDGVSQAALVFGIATAAIGLFAGGAVIARAKAIELKAQLDLTNASMGRTAVVGGLAGIALTGVIAVVGLLAQAHAEAKAKVESYADSLAAGTNRVTHATRELASEALSARKSFLWMEHDSAYDAAEKLGISLDLVTDAATGNADSLRQLQTELDAASKLSLAHAGSAGEVRNAVERETGAIDEAIRVADQKAAADASAAQAAKEHENALSALAGAATDAEFDIDSLVDTILNFGSAELDAREAARNFEAAIDDLSASVQENGATLDIGTDKGRANEKALDAIAQAALKTASATLTQTGSQEQATAAVQRGRDELINALGQFGITGQAAQDYADKLGLIPANINTAINADTSKAQIAVDSYISRNTGREVLLKIAGVPVAQGLGGSGGLVQKDGGVVSYYADGAVEHHVAQIARAGSMRVWGEPETMGETYVPHAEAKRARSEQIMSETASLFGGQYISRDAVQSGRTGGGSTPSISVPITVVGSPGMNVDQLTSRVKTAVIQEIERKFKW
ncbi:phage tail tape measure protein [Microbacterium sp. 16-032]|uniref:phage tail tape measure protein n=1 Tax=Microbacterium sp. 16-032 TaxID=3239808 RepID=UPI0034E1DC63